MATWTRQLKRELSAQNPYLNILCYGIPVLLLTVLLYIGFTREGSQQFSELAEAFNHGKLYFLYPIGGVSQDPVLYHGHVFWGEGPFPAVLLMPFVGLFSLFHLFFYQGYLKWILIFGILYFIYKLARTLLYSIGDSLLLAVGFTLGGVFIGVASVSSSWLFAQVLTTFLLFWSLYEFYTRKRWWLIGSICGLILLSRISAFPIVVFFGLELWQTITQREITVVLKKFMPLYVPALIAAALLGVYNVARFHNPLNNGSSYQLISASASIARSYGVFSLAHIPTNVYSAFFRGPETVLQSNNSWTLKFPFITNNNLGMSMFITSPYLIYLFTRKWKAFNLQARNLLVAILLSGLCVFSYYGIGAQQFGYRYALDFMPELFLLFMIMYKHGKRTRLSDFMKVLLVCSGIFNFLILWTYI